VSGSGQKSTICATVCDPVSLATYCVKEMCLIELIDVALHLHKALAAPM